MSGRWASCLAGVTLLLAGLGLGNAGAVPADVFFHEGVAACQSGDYAKGAKAFREAFAVQPASGTLLNLGLADWRRGRVGDAILSWERAAWMNPFNREASHNLRFAREIASLDEPDLTWYEIASTWLPANAWAWLADASLWFTVGIVTLPVILRRRKTGWHQALAAVGLGIFLFSLPACVGVITRSTLGFVLETNVPLRLTPTRDAETVATLSAGEPARTVRRHGDYVLIRTPNGSGWVVRSELALVCPVQK